MGHIAECHAAFCQQSPDILPHPLRLPHYVAGMDHMPLVVDARCARDVYVAAVAIFYQCATLESHSVVNSAVEVARGIEIALLGGREPRHGVCVELYERGGAGREATDACRGDIMRLGGQPLPVEYSAPCLDHAGILRVDIAHVEPCPDTVSGKRRASLPELLHISAECPLRLPFSVAAALCHPHHPQMAVAVVLCDGHSPVLAYLCPALQIDP